MFLNLFKSFIFFLLIHQLVAVSSCESAGVFNRVDHFTDAPSLHSKGINGEGVAILAIEDKELIGLTPKALKGVRIISSQVSLTKDLVRTSHSFHVLGILQQIAPKANLGLATINANLVALEKAIADGFYPIFNASFLFIRPIEEVEYFECIVNAIRVHNRLWVQSAGNDGKAIEKQVYIQSICSRIPDNILIVLATDKENRVTIFSNTPEDNLLLQQKSLAALGHDVLSFDCGDTLKKKSGTSMSTPVVSGAAALLLSKHRTFTTQDIQNVLLYSASRTFFAGKIYYYEFEKIPAEEWLKYKKSGFVQMPFDPRKYGMGILDLERAFVFAHFWEIAKASGEELSALEIRSRLPQAVITFPSPIDINQLATKYLFSGEMEILDELCSSCGIENFNMAANIFAALVFFHSKHIDKIIEWSSKNSAFFESTLTSLLIIGNVEKVRLFLSTIPEPKPHLDEMKGLIKDPALLRFFESIVIPSM